MPGVQPIAPRLRHTSSIIAFDLAPGVRHGLGPCLPPSQCTLRSGHAFEPFLTALFLRHATKFYVYYTNLRMCHLSENFLVLLTFFLNVLVLLTFLCLHETKLFCSLLHKTCACGTPPCETSRPADTLPSSLLHNTVHVHSATPPIQCRSFKTQLFGRRMRPSIILCHAAGASVGFREPSLFPPTCENRPFREKPA